MTVIRIQRKSKAERINECMKINRDNNEGTGFTTVQYYSSDVCYLVCQGEESQVKGHFKDFHADLSSLSISVLSCLIPEVAEYT